jgi:hypothetical protein
VEFGSEGSKVSRGGAVKFLSMLVTAQCVAGTIEWSLELRKRPSIFLSEDRSTGEA